jgi:hypothetical protein
MSDQASTTPTTIEDQVPELEFPCIVGKDCRSMPHQLLGRIDFMVVLVRWDHQSISAHRGAGDAEWVKDRGDALTIDEAKAHFPSLEFYMASGHLRYGEL